MRIALCLGTVMPSSDGAHSPENPIIYLKVNIVFHEYLFDICRCDNPYFFSGKMFCMSE